MNKDDDLEDDLDNYYNKWLAERGKSKRAAEKIASQNAGLVALTRVASVLTDDCAECKDHLAAATAEAERLKKAIQGYLDGNYDSPRSKRPGKCEHGTWYYEACEECVDSHFRAALTPANP